MINKIIPDDVASCIWVDAGLLRYKLCDLGFDCENCAFDQVMRQRAEPSSKPSEARAIDVQVPDKGHGIISAAHPVEMRNDTQSKTGTPTNSIDTFFSSLRETALPDDRFYSTNHVWIMEMERGRYKVGLDHFASAFLSAPFLEAELADDAGGIIMPKEGAIMVHDAPLAWIILDDETIVLESPINMKILKVNPGLKNLPLSLDDGSYNSGWICEVELPKRDAVRRAFMDSKSATTLYHKQINTFEQAVSGVEQNSVGITMMDGGVAHVSLKSIVGVHQYSDMLRVLMCAKG